MISNQKSPSKFVFVHANKTGGNSVNSALDNYGFKYPSDDGFYNENISLNSASTYGAAIGLHTFFL